MRIRAAPMRSEKWVKVFTEALWGNALERKNAGIWAEFVPYFPLIPAKAGIQIIRPGLGWVAQTIMSLAARTRLCIWIPAFAGMSGVGTGW